MKFFITLICISLMTCIGYSAHAQANVLDPNDPDIIFTASNHPTAPSWGVISKWGHSTRLSWNPFSVGYKSYYFKGMAFRIKFPRSYQHNVADGRKYPSFFFFHGLGEYGNIWDNELQLLHGGELHAAKVNDGTFDGFLIYPQSSSGYLPAYFGAITDLVDSLAKYVKLDLDRVSVSGLSGGGQSTWDILQTENYAKVFCSALPISAAQNEDIQYFPNHITVPIWVANGGKDNNPTPEAVVTVMNAYRALGGNITQAYYPLDGHGSWYDFWAEPNYFPFLNAVHKANPLVYFQRAAFCPNDSVNVKLGLQGGFYAYEWQKNGVTIPGATSKDVTVTSYGQYRGRFKRKSTSDWSDWSPTPVVISAKEPTVTPPIQINGMRSNVLPATDGNTTVPLMVPNTYASYEWRRTTDNAVVGTANIYNAPIGSYKVKVTEQYGCSSDFSPSYTVIAANGTNVPDKASNVSAIAISNNTVQLDWNDNPTPINNETAFEIYRSTTPGGNYTLIAKKGTDVLAHLDQGLSANTRYYYVIRAINNNGASAISTEVSVLTKQDVVPPTAPLNLRTTNTTRNSVSLAWDESTDDVGVKKYDVYVNGVKTYSTPNATFTVYNLTAYQTYSFYIKAKDASGNASPASNQITAAALLTGLNYKYYQGDWDVLPDFNALTPFSTGMTANVDLVPRVQNDYFGFLWEGYINIPVTGTYTFETYSDDGSKLYIGTPYSYSATPVVNNDGLHGGQFASGNITLTAGVYPIAMTFFEKGGGEVMNIYWACPEAGIASRTPIPNSAFTDVPSAVGPAPAAPSFLNVLASSYNRVNLSWTDNSNNETGFEIVRSTTLLGTYIPVGTVAANVTSFIDSTALSANTKYWYKIRSVNNVGGSAFISVVEGMWGLNNDYNDGSGNNRILTGGNSPVFAAADKKEGTHSLTLNGSNQYVDMPFSTSSRFPSNSYTTRTASVWIKPTAVSGTNRIVFDYGGSDNGLGLRFNANGLEAGIASNNVRNTATVSNIASNPNWVLNGWNHVAVVYNVNTLKLIVNGAELASTSLSFTSVAASSSPSRLGASSGTNAFNSSSSSTNMAGQIDDVVILTEPVNAGGAAALMTQSYTADTTFALPTIPANPTNLVATPQSPSDITLQWNDNSNNETGFEIYRSVANTNGFRLLAVVNPGIGSSANYTDNSLFANTQYYYKVRAIGIGGNSTFTTDTPAKTGNNLPRFGVSDNITMRYETQKQVAVTATDADGENLTMTVQGLPAFASSNVTANGAVTLTFNPAITDQGTYNIAVIAADGNNGKDTAAFTLTVNANYPPVITPVTPITLNEGVEGNYTLVATDQDGNNSLVWSLTTGTAFATLTSNGDGTATLKLKPGYAQAGNYTLSGTVIDDAGGSTSILFSVTVNNANPPSEKTFISIKHSSSAAAAAPWNNITGVTTNNLINANNQTTPTGLEFLTSAWNTWNEGAVTGNNSGVYPDDVMRDYYYFGIFGAPNTVDFRLKGLNTQLRYNITLLASSAWTGTANNGSTVYTINGVSKPLNAHFNQQNTVTFSSISPDASGYIQVGMSKDAGTPVGYLNAIVLEKPFDDSTAPAAPVNLSAQALSNGFVKLNWKDIAYNEKNYLVYRATNAAGPYTLLNSGASNADDSTYTDNTVLSSTSYFYKIQAANQYGSSTFTNTVNAVTLNKVPVLNTIADVFVKTGNTATVNIAGTDDAADVLTVTVTNLPSFATYLGTGNGAGTITILPGTNNIGIYKNITVKVADNYGASATQVFDIAVTDNSTRSVYVNFGPEGGTPQAAPWNNYLAFPFANLTLSSLKDDGGVNTGFTVKLLQQWTGNFLYGMTTGDDNGVYPDNVIQSSIYSNSTDPRTIEFTGLNPAKVYNIALLSSINSGADATVTFASGTQSATINGRYNSNIVAQLNGLVPNASGVLQVTATKNSAAPYLNLNALVIQEYTSTTTPIRPINLYAESDLSSNRLKLTWSDRSSIETGYKVWRSTQSAGTYTLVATLAANTTTYTDNTVAADTRYYYKVTAIRNAATSDYSNIAAAIASGKAIFINLEVNYPADAPWNNTNAVPTEGATFSNLKENSGKNTGYEMVITKPFNGEFFAGFDGAGIFPSNVMKSSYWADAGQTCEVKFRNLDQSKRYRIGCFGSSMWNNYFIARYTVNSRSVELNSYQNSTKVVYLSNIIPTEDGEITLKVNTVDGSPYSFTGAFTIEYFNDDIPANTEVTPGTLQQGRFAQPVTRVDMDIQQIEPAKPVTAAPVAETTVADKVGSANTVSVYPNPFTNKIQVEVNSKAASSVSIMLYDLNSKLVYRSNTFNVKPGKNTVNLNLPGSPLLVPGNYILNVWIDGVMTKSVKLLKN